MLPGLTARQGDVLRWADEHRRDLPWRATRDPWKVLVSELMLQQTQVARVLPKYEDFLAAFPTVAACAAGSVADVVTLWAGLGYNRRAVNLHRCAVAVVDEHGGRIPDDLAALVKLPGIGPYTARAVLAFAYEQDVAIVDTNVARVLARWSGRPLMRREVQDLADSIVPTGEGWTWNQGMLDLGATVCAKRFPRCERCPVTRECAWFAASHAEPDPAVGSAGVSGGQSKFEGSDRQGRGRMIDALRLHGTIERDQIAAFAGWPGDDRRALRVAETLIADGLAEWSSGGLTFPGAAAP